MLLRLPSNLHYPITIIKIDALVGDTIKLNDDLFMYSYMTKVKQGSRYEDEEEEVDKKFVAHFQSTLEGSIRGWRVWDGDVIDRPVDVCEVEEECAHTVQFSGMCTNCGKDMTEFEPGSGTPNTDRAQIQALHDSQHLTISRDEANKIDEEAKRRLLSARKLSLVVDLDQTIIHAAVDPTIAEWQKDKDNPNHDAVKDVRSFQLIDDGPGMRGCWYYIKLRPGLEEFLEHISQIYELHIYTMGTRQYAQQIANIVDPARKYFGDRILSRDESGSMVAKNLERLFPVDTKMVVIIDDRGDVWKWSANLVRVTPFDFFVGIGDINSSFLPKKEEIQSTPKAEKQDAEPETEESNGDHKPNGVVAEDGTSTIQNGTSALEHLIGMSGSDDPALREIQSKGQEEIISSQLEDKPLLRMQQEQDERDQAEATTNEMEENIAVITNGESQATQNTDSDSSSSSESDKSPTPPKSKARHSILKNDDEELVHLEARLTAVHTAFYSELDRKRMSGKGGRVAALAGKRKAPLPLSSTSDGEAESQAELQMIPDVKRVMPSMKMRVLAGVVIVFSGVLPLGTDVQTADISTWAKTFGAKITDKVTKDVTHVIAARAGTAKVKQAVKRGIKVVGTSWLIESIQRWKKVDERRHLLEGAGRQRISDKEGGSSDIEHEALDTKAPMTSHGFLLSSDDDESSSAFGDLDGDAMVEFESEIIQPARKKLKINVEAANIPRQKPNGQGDDAEDFVDDGSPITINQDEWDDMDAELKEFMGSEAESESDTDSVTSALSYREKRSRKRQREDDDDNKEPNSTIISEPTSRPEKIPRRSGGSALKTVANVESADNTETSTPADVDNQRIDYEQLGKEEQERRDKVEEEESDDELARELEREMEGSPE